MSYKFVEYIFTLLSFRTCFGILILSLQSEMLKQVQHDHIAGPTN